MAVDTLLNNRFAINDTGIKPLGEGGMAIIYPGIDTETDESIAAKTLLPSYQGDSHRRARFRREAEVLKAVQHPYIVDLVDVVDGRRGTWILMEQLEGENLRDKLDREGAFDPKTVSAWLAPVCAALEHMHRLGYVHLDVTPQNIFLTDDGEVKLIDFGIAQKAFIPPKREGDKLLGTATYISPEHGSGRVVTPASDIYSLGCVAFELMTNKKVFSERANISNDETVSLRQDNVPDLPSSVAPELDLPLWVDSVIAKALLPNPDDRYPSATAFAEEFNTHANPPLLKLSWPNRKKQKLAYTERVEARSEPVAPRVEASTVPTTSEQRQAREHSRAGRWVRKELRNARRVTLVFALLLSLVFAAPMIGGSITLDWLLGFAPGSSTEVVGGDWNLRSGPTQESDVRTLLRQGQEVQVSGSPVVAEDGLWWPVSTEVDGERIHGFAFDPGLARTWLMDRAAGIELSRDTWGDRWDRVTGFLPG